MTSNFQTLGSNFTKLFMYCMYKWYVQWLLNEDTALYNCKRNCFFIYYFTLLSIDNFILISTIYSAIQCYTYAYMSGEISHKHQLQNTVESGRVYTVCCSFLMVFFLFCTHRCFAYNASWGGGCALHKIFQGFQQEFNNYLIVTCPCFKEKPI